MGISVQEYFTFVVEQAVLRDEHLETYFDKIKEQKIENMKKGGAERIAEQTFYEIFEKNLNEK